ncbi:hypothetical protein E2C01_051697 [Portunus trituberculatus]|uniref:Uncharacterized protein n=1 Tax=Portunus trituberculatus TaxID=210409 RepID=A0A5B7GBQ3_PORTR|nr:hypothetical protein [Portunus trituberculatus]
MNDKPQDLHRTTDYFSMCAPYLCCPVLPYPAFALLCAVLLCAALRLCAPGLIVVQTVVNYILAMWLQGGTRQSSQTRAKVDKRDAVNVEWCECGAAFYVVYSLSECGAYLTSPHHIMPFSFTSHIRT